jgi:hypothetical protein
VWAYQIFFDVHGCAGGQCQQDLATPIAVWLFGVVAILGWGRGQ